MLGVAEVRGCACWWWLIFELVLMAKAKATAKTCWGCSPYPSVTFAHDCEGANFRARAGRAAENGTSEANGKSKVQTCILRLFALPESRVVRQYTLIDTRAGRPDRRCSAVQLGGEIPP